MIGIHGEPQCGKTHFLYHKWVKNEKLAIVFPSVYQRDRFIKKYRVVPSDRSTLTSWDNMNWLRGRNINNVMIDNIDGIFQSVIPYPINFVTFTGSAYKLEIPYEPETKMYNQRL